MQGNRRHDALTDGPCARRISETSRTARCRRIRIAACNDFLWTKTDEWEIRPGDSIPAKIAAGLVHSRVLVLCMSAQVFGSDPGAPGLQAGTFRFGDPLNQQRRFIPLRLHDAPIKGSLAQFLYVNRLPADRVRKYAKLLEAYRPLA